ncbi:MAG TPA: hypothetical protein VFT98_22995 [Myxococcota bacterium]|nr:hypothetical protein [Myxococcota bacterium]
MILPPPDNDYRGSRFAIWFLWFQIALNAFRGWVHVFWADSGAGRIAGIDLSTNAAPIVSLLASVGVDQLAWGVIELGVVTRYRRWIPTLLAFLLAKQIAAAWLLWIWKPLGVEAPGKLGALVGLPLVALALWLALRESGAKTS